MNRQVSHVARFLLTVLMVAMTAAMLFAGGNGERIPAGDGSAEVVFWHSNSGLLGEAMTELVDTFNSTVGAQKGIVVTEVYQGKAADVATKLRASLQADRPQDLPDLAQLDATGVMDVRDSVHMVPVQELADADPEFSLDALEPGAVLSMAYKGRLIGMPFNASTILLYYNKDAFREAGLDPERPPGTLAELADYAGRLVKRSADGKTIERYGFAGVPSTYELVSWIGQQNGVSFITDMANGHDGNPTRVVFDEEGTLATFLTAWRNVYESGGLGNLTSDVRREFVAGRTAMYAASTSSLSTVISSIGGRFELGVGYLPKVDETATGGVNIGGGAIFAFENGNDPGKAASWEFLKFLLSGESQFTWHRRTGYFPVSLDTYKLPEFEAHIAGNPLFKVAIDQLHDSDPRVQSVWWPNSYQAYYEIQNGIIEMLEKDIGVDETVAKLSSVLNGYMAEYNRMNGN